MRKSLLALLAIVILETSALAVEKIRIGFPDLAVPFVPLAIADKRGFFQEDGLQEEFIRINRAIAFQALVGGEIDYYTVLGPGVAAAIRGVPVKLMAAHLANALRYPGESQETLRELRNVAAIIGGKSQRRRPSIGFLHRLTQSPCTASLTKAVS